MTLTRALAAAGLLNPGKLRACCGTRGSGTARIDYTVDVLFRKGLIIGNGIAYAEGIERIRNLKGRRNIRAILREILAERLTHGCGCLSL